MDGCDAADVKIWPFPPALHEPVQLFLKTSYRSPKVKAIYYAFFGVSVSSSWDVSFPFFIIHPSRDLKWTVLETQ